MGAVDWFSIVIGLLGGVVIAILLVSTIKWLSDFSRELRYLNHEIARSDGADLLHWQRRRRRLWLSLLPFISYQNE